ncbi:unnamed protein product (macronuclear) [Paramecium tetraurelia]|uniref:Transmembrane protein n=1 Tax=Paramecium tetraurelia TaxID=5888 RepID=A0BZL9_PARTE|nr:uncharacterized protein GSPATT00005838001 [Paramecium tetraurelia]CAK63986.1 unnamed protein product [Paramecium tetraurelia]|eukprot:XP_001431384.1 hypothetical protein (macronuclear) [Paramecium tetraurelia strain d4-2]
MNTCGSNIHVHFCFYITLKPLMFVITVPFNLLSIVFSGFLSLYLRMQHLNFASINNTFHNRRSQRQIIKKPQITYKQYFQAISTNLLYIQIWISIKSIIASRLKHSQGGARSWNNQFIFIITNSSIMRQLAESKYQQKSLACNNRTIFSQLILELLSKVEQDVMNVETLYVRHQLMKILIQFNYQYIMHRSSSNQHHKNMNYKIIS